jgi:hypothetical protein
MHDKSMNNIELSIIQINHLTNLLRDYILMSIAFIDLYI